MTTVANESTSRQEHLQNIYSKNQWWNLTQEVLEDALGSLIWKQQRRTNCCVVARALCVCVERVHPPFKSHTYRKNIVTALSWLLAVVCGFLLSVPSLPNIRIMELRDGTTPRPETESKRCFSLPCTLFKQLHCASVVVSGGS